MLACLPGLLHITDDIEGHTGPSRASSVGSYTGELPSSAQVQLRGVDLEPGGLAEGAVPGLPVARYAE